MPAVKISQVDKLKAAVTAFEATQAAYSEFGAMDTEPDGVFQYTLARAINGNEVVMPVSSRDWQLYSDVKGCGAAARALTAACRKAVKIILGAKLKDSAAVRAYLLDYCWRANVD
jgi:hypothetical protein